MRGPQKEVRVPNGLDQGGGVPGHTGTRLLTLKRTGKNCGDVECLGPRAREHLNMF